MKSRNRALYPTGVLWRQHGMVQHTQVPRVLQKLAFWKAGFLPNRGLGQLLRQADHYHSDLLGTFGGTSSKGSVL